jgi:hypothetical protein
LTPDEIALLDEQAKAGYPARSFFTGATPLNNYMPAHPYTVTVFDNPYVYVESEYAELYVHCGGAESPRPITMRRAGDCMWYLWGHALLAGIQPPA